MSKMFISSQQIVSLLPVFELPKFETIKLDVLCVLISRMLDLENVSDILIRVDEDEEAMLIHRLGWLNLFNPNSPDGNYDLDLIYPEERTIARMLVVLAIVEPGENWTDESFQWNISGEAIPGWELPKTWLNEEGFPDHGRLQLTYHSELEMGCAPVWNARRLLMKNVLLGYRLTPNEIDEPLDKCGANLRV
jgi:hypothetical protein